MCALSAGRTCPVATSCLGILKTTRRERDNQRMLKVRNFLCFELACRERNNFGRGRRKIHVEMNVQSFPPFFGILWENFPLLFPTRVSSSKIDSWNICRALQRGDCSEKKKFRMDHAITVICRINVTGIACCHENP